jgi:ABC-type cobalamin/Fe3+-siderophores transport system ATPase subunit
VTTRTRAGLTACAPQTTPAVYGIPTADFIAAGAYRITDRIYTDPHVEQALRDVLVKVKLEDKARQEFGSLSGGEKRRALLARALLQNACWTLLDEPASFLDYAHIETLYTLLCALKKENRNLILVTHDADFAAALADRVIFLRSGKVWREGTSSLARDTDILEELFAAAFKKYPGARVLPAYSK